MTEPVLSARGLGKKYCRDFRRSLHYGLRDVLRELAGREAPAALRESEFWAIEDASFDLQAGESLGIVGRNGAGKSTLLKIAAGVLKPDRGSLAVRGRVGALIALGAGFNPLLTGRENLYASAMLHGYSRREVDALADEIIAFSGLAESIDMPVQNYSSGMYARLGFAVAVHVDPDLMLVDEVLAVGDAAFQRKCFDRIHQMQARGTSFVVVSHNPYQIERLCQKSAVLSGGRLSPLMEGREAVALYHDLVQADAMPAAGAPAAREGTQELRFERVRLEGPGVRPDGTVVSMEAVRLVAEVNAARAMTDVRFRFEVCAADDSVLAMLTTIGLTERITFQGRHRVSFALEPCALTSGWYSVNAVAVDRGVRLDVWPRALEFKVRLGEGAARDLTSDNGRVVLPGRWTIE